MKKFLSYVAVFLFGARVMWKIIKWAFDMPHQLIGRSNYTPSYPNYSSYWRDHQYETKRYI